MTADEQSSRRRWRSWFITLIQARVVVVVLVELLVVLLVLAAAVVVVVRVLVVVVHERVYRAGHVRVIW